jgi:hypothetical protein
MKSENRRNKLFISAISSVAAIDGFLFGFDTRRNLRDIDFFTVRYGMGPDRVTTWRGYNRSFTGCCFRMFDQWEIT